MSKCNNCDKYDYKTHSCSIFCDVIRNTLEDVRADERRKFAEWLNKNVYINVESSVADVRGVEYTIVISFEKFLEMYEKEVI